MAVGLHVLEDLGDLAFSIDQERGARDALHLLAIHVLLFDHAKSFTQLLLRVGEQMVGKVILLLEFFLRGRSIGGNAVDGEAGLLEFLECVAEPARFYGSTGCVSLGIEEQDDVLPAKVFQAYDRTVLVRQAEIRCLLTFCHESLPQSKVIPQHAWLCYLGGVVSHGLALRARGERAIRASAQRA